MMRVERNKGLGRAFEKAVRRKPLVLRPREAVRVLTSTIKSMALNVCSGSA